MADGGPGFVDVLHEALGGELLAVAVRGPHGDPVPGAVLLKGDRAWVESAQACGLALTGGERAESATTWGVGELVVHAIEAGATDIVVGLGGSGTNDGGAGLLGALGATADRPLDEGADRSGRRHPGRPRGPPGLGSPGCGSPVPATSTAP